MLAIILTVLGIGGLICLHEFGHFLAARAGGMRVLCFSIGFGPKLWSKTIGETQYRIAAIPLGGYVMVDGGVGEDEPDEDEKDEFPVSSPDDPKRYENRSFWAKLAYIFAGPFANWVVAMVIAIAALMVGLPHPVDDKAMVGDVEPGSPAAKIELRAGDQIIAIGGHEVTSWQSMIETLAGQGGVEQSIVIMRDGQSLALTFTPDGEKGGQGKVGIYPQTENGEGLSFGAALIAGPVYTWQQSVNYVPQLIKMVTGRGEGKFVGIPGIGRMVYKQAEAGAGPFLMILFMLSMSLAFFNLLPIPALDGGRLLFLLVGLCFPGRQVPPKIEGYIHMAGFILVFGLIILVSIRDIIAMIP